MIATDWNRMYHQQNLQIHGIFVPTMDALTDKNGRRIFREFRLQFSFKDSNMDAVSLKLPAVSGNMTPYSLHSEELLYKGEKLTFPDVIIYRVPLPPEESTWHLKGYTFPFRGSKNPYHELRLNLRISGYCPGKCFFCHRTHSHRIKPIERKFPDPKEIIDRIVEAEGGDIFSRITRIMIICELFGREDRFLETVCTTANELAHHGYSTKKEFNCCAQDVRSYEGHKKLLGLVRPARYSFTLEFFRNRQKLMGWYKGLPMEEVYRVLESARCAGFKEIQLNYLAGIDSLDECEKGFERLVHLGLVDSVGLSTFTFFSEEQMSGRHKTAWEPSYYLKVVEILNSLGIKIHRPKSYDMGTPYTILMENTKI